MFGVLLPAAAHASVFNALLEAFTGTAEAKTVNAASSETRNNLQTLSLPRPAMNIDPAPARGGGDITIVDGSALLPEEGPAGTIADIDKPSDGTISLYVVRAGDTVSSIAAMYDVSPNTILAANNLPKGVKLKEGQKLTILPVTGIKYTIKKGDTLASVAKRYGGNVDEIISRNDIEAGMLTVGDEIIIPNVDVPTVTEPVRKSKTTARGTAGNQSSTSGAQIGSYLSPLARYVRTQGIHGYNAVDLAAPSGTPIRAAAAGEVVVAKSSGWNGGYGSYVVVQHAGGSQTLYAHMSKVTASDGESVGKGDVIGYVGQTGIATGPHLHFEIRNGVRNPF